MTGGLELKDGKLTADFGPRGRATIDLTQTLRVPMDGKDYPLPAGLQRIPMEATAGLKLPGDMAKKHGAVVPMYQNEGVYITLDSNMPVMVRVYQGGVNTATGQVASGPGMPISTTGQDGYIQQPRSMGPDQRWIDGIKNSGANTVKQFVAAPLGHGMTTEEQVKGQKTDLQGGLQIEVIPLKQEYIDKLGLQPQEPARTRGMTRSIAPAREMGVAAGGNIKQRLIDIDPNRYPPDAWDVSAAKTTSLGIVNAESWKDISGKDPQRPPLTKEQYAAHKLPWFEYNSGPAAKAKETALDGVKTIKQLQDEALKGAGLPPIDEGTIVIDPKKVKDLAKPSGTLPAWGQPPADVPSGEIPGGPSSQTRCGGHGAAKTRGCSK